MQTSRYYQIYLDGKSQVYRTACLVLTIHVRNRREPVPAFQLAKIARFIGAA